MARVFAKWTGITRMPEDLSDIHISCGFGENQSLGFDLNDTGAMLTVKFMGNSEWEVTFTADSAGIEEDESYWLSPTLINDEIEATDFGIEHDAPEA